jgi:YgiT-type zinc finger domain-containing protein
MPVTPLMPDRCEYCGGTNFVEKTVEKMHRHRGRYYLFRGVPVVVCRSCGERYWSGPVLRQITRQIQESHKLQERLTVPVLELGV